jgi:hypothetical protein
MAARIYCQHWINESFTVTTTGGAAPSCSFTAGVQYLAPDDVIARLNATLGALVTFAIDDTTGLVSVTWGTSPATLTWGNSDLSDYLGFGGNLTHADTVGVQPVEGWWYGKAAGPWGLSRRIDSDDVISNYGRATMVDRVGYYETGKIEIWLHRSIDGTFLDSMAAAYDLAVAWAANPIAIDDGSGTYRPCVLVDSWEFAPQSLDPETVYLELEVITWPAG